MSKRKASSPLVNGDEEEESSRGSQTTPKRSVMGGVNPLSLNFPSASTTTTNYLRMVPSSPSSSVMASSSGFKHLQNCPSEIESLNANFISSVESAFDKNRSACLIPICESYMKHFFTLVLPSHNQPKSSSGIAKFLDKFKSLKNQNQDYSNSNSKKHKRKTKTTESPAPSKIGETGRKIATSTKPYEQKEKERTPTGNVFKNFQFSSNGAVEKGITQSSGGGLFSVPTNPPPKMNGMTATPGLFSFKSPAPAFSFGLNSNSAAPPPQPQNSTTNNDGDDEDEEPPKNEFRPVVEEDSVYSTRVKLYGKGPQGFNDKGVGQLYVKKLGSGKYQIVVRADNSLGTILLNMIMPKNLPLTLKPKGVLTCDPTGENGKPLMILIRVKTDDDAKQLLKKLQSFIADS